MPFSFNEKSGLLLIFFFHGIIFSLLLLRKGIIHQNKSNRWLSLLLFLCALYIVPYMLGYANWYSEKTTREILFFIPFMQVLLIGPVVFFYTKSLLDNHFKLSRKSWVHFIPAILYFVYSFIIFITDKFIFDEYYFYADGRDKDLADWYQALGLCSMTLYLIASLRYYAHYKKKVYDEVSYADAILFKWIQHFMFAFLGILILRALFFILNPEWGEFGSQFWHYMSFSLVFYYISINGYSNAVKVSFLNDSNSKTPHQFTTPIEVETVQETSLEKDIHLWKERLLKLITEDKIYENSRLTLIDVAQALKTNAKQVSVIVNSGFNMNFNDFINHYRIEAVKAQLHKKIHHKTTLLGIAFDCGFNSKATFNRAFKKSTLLSPKDYIKKIDAK